MSNQEIQALKNELAALETKRAIVKAMHTVENSHKIKRGYTYRRSNGI